MVTLDQHMATLKAQDSNLTGESIRVPFPGRADYDGAKDQPCLVTAVLERTAVVVPDGTPVEAIHSGAVTTVLLNARRITIDPADVQVIDRSAHRAKVISAARGRRASRNNSFGRAGKGVGQAAESRQSHQEAQKGV